MSLDELILEEPLKISKRELEEAEKAYETFMLFCYHLQELSIYYLDEKVNKYARELQRQIKSNLKLILLTIMRDERFCDKEALEFLKTKSKSKKEADADAD